MEFLTFAGTLLLLIAAGLILGFRIRNLPARALGFALAGICAVLMVWLLLNIENSGGGTRVPPTSSVFLGEEKTGRAPRPDFVLLKRSNEYDEIGKTHYSHCA